MRWITLLKFLTGFTLAIAVLFFTGASVSRYLITRLTTPPPKPIFPNDTPAATPPPAEATTPSPSPVSSEPAAASPSPAPADAPAPSPSPSPDAASPSPSPTEVPGAYEARVTQPIGLVVRQEANRESTQVGSVEFNQPVTVLETSPDGEWLRVRLPGSGLEGWIKAGNTETIN